IILSTCTEGEGADRFIQRSPISGFSSFLRHHDLGSTQSLAKMSTTLCSGEKAGTSDENLQQIALDKNPEMKMKYERKQKWTIHHHRPSQLKKKSTGFFFLEAVTYRDSRTDGF
ncbi:hypothetical protein L9F63_006768, partial [Diploptera punctata]